MIAGSTESLIYQRASVSSIAFMISSAHRTASAIALTVAGIVKWSITRKWARYYGNPKNLVFPKVCPICLAAAEVVIDEESAKRATANYVVVRR